MKSLYLFGGGPHLNSCLEIINQTKRYKIIKIVEKQIKTKNNKKLKINIISEHNFKKIEKNSFAHISIGNYKLIDKRKKIFNNLIKKNFKIPSIISKKSIISKSAKIMDGTIIMNGCIINANAKIGKNCIINSGSIIEHDVIIEDHCIISPGTIINGSVRVGSLSFIGSGSVIINDISLPKKSFVKANQLIKK